MFVFKHSSDLRLFLQQNKKRTGFVPTMGALHAGHISLVNKAKSENELVVCSIFVNPTQFNNPDDFKTYPKTIENDLLLLAKAQCDVVFIPDYDDIYGTPAQPIDLSLYGNLVQIFEAAFRPGHFAGVIDVVTRLFKLVEPNAVYFGQKDYQQCLVIKKLIALNGFDISFVMCPSIRENNGLAMSSRNMRLTAEEAEKATTIYKILKHIADRWPGNPQSLIDDALKTHNRNNIINIEYLSICKTDDLTPADENDKQVVILIAAKVGSNRLIDNMITKT